MIVKEIAPAKINLFLEIVRKRPDGYHTLRTIFQKISLTDTLLFYRRNDKKLTLKIKKASPAISRIPDSKKNSIIQTAKLLQKKFSSPFGADIILLKKIPPGAGLGGASTDAAATIRGLNKLWNLNLSLKQKLKVAKEIGADVAFFLYPYSWALACGIGEKIISGGKNKKFYLLLIKPSFSISTARAYSFVTPQHLTLQKENTKIKRALKSNAPVSDFAKFLFNRFEEVLFPKYPELMVIKQKLIDSGATNALLTGSGSVVFGIFPDRRKLKSARKKLLKELPGCSIFLAHSI